MSSQTSITVEHDPPCTRFSISDFYDTKQRFLVYNVAHYDGSPRVPRGIPNVHPSARFLGCYATRDAILMKSQSIIEQTNHFALRITPTFQFDILSADQNLPLSERRSRIRRVLSALRATKERDAREMQERATRAHTERARLNAELTRERKGVRDASISVTASESGRAQKLDVHIKDYNWDMLESLIPVESVTSSRVDVAAREGGEGGVGEGGVGEGGVGERAGIHSLDDCEVPVTSRRAGQTHLILSLLEDEEHPEEPVFLAYKTSDREEQIERWMKDIGELFAPLNVYSVPLYEFGPLSGFDETLTLSDREYERNMNTHRPGIIAANEDELRDRIRREFRMDPDGDSAFWIRPGVEQPAERKRVFEMRSVTVKTMDEKGNVVKVEQLPPSSWRYLDEAEMRNLPRNVQDVRDMADGKLSALSEAMTSRSHAAANSMLAGRDTESDSK